MKALFDSAVRALSCPLLVVAANGCWTADAHDHTPDAAGVDMSALCGFAPSPCFTQVTLNTAPVLVDLAHGDPRSADPLNSDVTLQVTSPDSITVGVSFNLFPGPDVDAGNLNGLSRVRVPGDTDFPFHIKGNVPASAGWNMNWYYSSSDPGVYCGDPFNTKRIPIIDASDFDGVTIQLFGNAGPTGPKTLQMKFTIDSVETPEDPTRQQELQTLIDVPSTPTTFAFKWNDLTAICGSKADFQPGRIIGVAAAFRALAGIKYDLDIVIGEIGFIPKTQ
jgi:hypothetical protein